MPKQKGFELGVSSSDLLGFSTNTRTSRRLVFGSLVDNIPATPEQKRAESGAFSVDSSLLSQLHAGGVARASSFRRL